MGRNMEGHDSAVLARALDRSNCRHDMGKKDEAVEVAAVSRKRRPTVQMGQAQRKPAVVRVVSVRVL